MKAALHYVVLALAILPLNFAFAQFSSNDAVNLAVIGEINVTLNDNCQDSLLIQEVLAGDYDVDDNGIDVPFTAFTVIVEDGNEANGAIIDGCGTYSFRVEAVADFVGFTTGWGIINAEDKTPPIFTSTPTAPAGPLYCDAVDDIDINLLPNTVSRCYRVNSSNGLIINGTLDNQLRERLLAGGGLPTATDNCSPEVEICVTDIIERDAVNPQCNFVTLFRTFTVRDGDCPSLSGEDNAPGVTSYAIVFDKPELEDLNTGSVPPTVEIECDELESQGLAFGDVPSPRQQDLPFFPGPDGTTIPLQLGAEGSFCGIGLTYEDSPLIESCELGYKVIRTYTVLDWCEPGEIVTLTQIINIGDFTAPVFTAPTQDMDFDGQPDSGPLQFLTNAGNQCGAYIRLDDGTINLSDVCSSELTLTASIYPNGDLGATPFGAFTVDLYNNTAEITGVIPAGTHLLRYTYSDECDNVGFTDVDIVISDGTAPVAICEDGLNVSLTAGVNQDGESVLGLAVITPEMINANSNDDCSDVSLAIGLVQQNMDGSYGLLPGAAYGSRLDLTCDNIGTVLVGLEVLDGEDNPNYCWLSVLVEDKIAPTCVPPANMDLTCTEFAALGLPNNLNTVDDDAVKAAFGEAFGQDNCSTTVYQSIDGGVNTCGEGVFERSFRILDGVGNNTVCTQTINIRSVFDYTISFPGDEEIVCMEEPVLTDVTALEGGCDLIIKDVSVDTFQSQVDECYVLRVSHLVINFCEYNTLGEPYLIRRDADGDGDLSERVFLHLLPRDDETIDDDWAILDSDADRTNGNPIPFAFLPVDDGNDNDGSDDNNGNDSEESQAPNGIGYPYGTDNSRGAFLYHQFIAVYDEVAPEITIFTPADCFAAQSANCTGSVELSFNAEDACTTAEQLGVRVELDQDYSTTTGFNRDRFLLASEFNGNANGNFTVNLNNVPVGNHAVRIRVADGCGNFDVSELEFCVSDALAPTPICIGQITVTLMPNADGTGNAAIWANDFIASDVEDCSGEVSYSIYTEVEATDPNFDPVPGRDGIILDCTSDASVPVRVYAFDPAGRGDYCSVIVLVQGAENACANGDLGNLGGVILSENGLTFGDVAVTLESSDMNTNGLTGQDGSYLFQNLPLDDDYTMSAGLDTYVSHSQGVSTFDLVLITQHILGQVPITSPYQLLAADANNDEEVTVQDLIAIRRFILGYDLEFPNNEPYRFVDEDFIFPLNNNPWATNFPEVVNVNNLSGNVFDADFIGIMVGDVNGDGLDNLLGSDGQPRSRGISLSVDNMNLVTGQTYDVAIDAGEATNLKGLQGTFRVTGANIDDLAYGQFTPGDVNPALLERGLIPFSYSEVGGLAPEGSLLTLRITAERDGSLEDILSITDDQLYTEGYTQENEVINLALNFQESTTPTGAFTASNYPNPMREQTTISYQLPEEGAVSLTVQDLNGRILVTRELAGTSGLNQTRLSRRDFPAAGIYTYTLRMGKEMISRKLLVK